MKTSSAKYLVFFLVFCFATGHRLYSQGSVSLSAGGGFPDAVNLGFRLRVVQERIDFYGGFLPSINDKSMTSLQLAITYNFAGQSAHTWVPPWYARGGISYLKEKEKYWRKNSWYLDLRAGKAINFSKNAGLEIDAGLAFRFAYSTRYDWDYYWDYYNYDEKHRPGVTPVAGMRFFLNL
ncbi:MAG: hypothetical protein K0B09_11840 [Bacteroidales bacterium]|nr:hypothetical protein [Bacteroidales bacterium]